MSEFWENTNMEIKYISLTRDLEKWGFIFAYVI